MGSSLAPTTANRPRGGFVQEIGGLSRLRLVRMLVLTGLLVLAGAVAFQLKFSVIDLDIWWHLKVGDWIVQHAAFPHNGILSRSAADRPWAAYSWGYEVLLSRFYAAFGILGIGIYGTLLTLMVAFSVYWMARRLSGNFWVAAGLGAICCYAFLFLMMPRPVFFSIALFCVTLTLLLESERSGDIRRLYWLPPVFLLWANLHIQFIYGLGVVGLFVACQAGLREAVRFGIAPAYLGESKIASGKLMAVFGACVLATLIGPYSYHLYGVIFAYSRSQLIYSTIKELQPLSFRTYENYAELLLAGAAFFAVAWRKKIDVFKALLLVMACVVAFRTMRDSWFLCVAAAACMADAEAEEERESDGGLALGGVFTGVAITLLLVAPAMGFNTRGLDRAISAMFPVDAVNFVRQNRLPGPVYNNFDWGGFLTWYLPDYPVVIDGRTDLYGEELDNQLLATQDGEASYKEDHYLNEAGFVLLRRRDGLVAVLELDPRFRKVYEDQLATVFVRW